MFLPLYLQRSLSPLWLVHGTGGEQVRVGRSEFGVEKDI